MIAKLLKKITAIFVLSNIFRMPFPDRDNTSSNIYKRTNISPKMNARYSGGGDAIDVVIEDSLSTKFTASECENVSSDVVKTNSSSSGCATSPIFVAMGLDVDVAATNIRKIGRDVVFLYDVDDTLYSYSSGALDAEWEFLQKMYTFIHKVDPTVFAEKVREIHLYSEVFYESGIPLETYWKKIIDKFDYLQYVPQRPELRRFLLSAKENVRVCCFSNSCCSRVENTLRKIGIFDCFEVAICLGEYDTTFCRKPKKEAYRFVVNLLGIEEPSSVHFFDDSKYNIEAAKSFGWNTYLISENDDIIDFSKKVLKSVLKNTKKRHLSTK